MTALLRDSRGSTVAMPTPNHIRAFELRLKANWSSEDVVQMLTPTFVESVLLKGFAALEPTTKVRTSYSSETRVLCWC